MVPVHRGPPLVGGACSGYLDAYSGKFGAEEHPVKMSRRRRWIAILAAVIGLTFIVVVAGLWSQGKLPGQPMQNTSQGMPDPLRALEVSTYYQYNPDADPVLWDVQLFLAGCCWSDRIVHASMRQASTGVSAPGWVDGNFDPDIRLLRDGSLSPAILLKFRGRFHVGPAALEVCDSHHCAKATVMIPEPQPPHAAIGSGS